MRITFRKLKDKVESLNRAHNLGLRLQDGSQHVAIYKESNSGGFKNISGWLSNREAHNFLNGIEWSLNNG